VEQVLRCDCGFEARGKQDDELVAEVRRHASDAHGMALSPDEALLLVFRAQFVSTALPRTFIGEPTRGSSERQQLGQRGGAMKRTRRRALITTGIAGVGVLLATALIVVPALATPPSGFTSVQLAPVAQFGEINEKAKYGDWEAELETKGLSDLHVTQVTVQPGGTSGWHSHRGPSLGIVKSGTATFYFGDDPTCTPHVIQAGSSFFEPAGRVHILRNETDPPETVVNVVVQLVPTGTARRIDEPDPGNCPF
jgi:quercetin dioxygenase-like cupin family protein